MVLAAGDVSDANSSAALEWLCRQYWMPVYNYIRSRGFGPEDAEDLTQSFFAQLLSLNAIGQADPERGKFRTFLLACARNFCCKDWQRRNRLKNGGGKVNVSLDAEESEGPDIAEDVGSNRAEKEFDRNFARTLVQKTYEQLGREYQARGRGELFKAIKGPAFAFDGEPLRTYRVIAADLDLSVEAVTSAVHRLRKRYRELLREEVAQTVGHPSEREVDEELKYLLSILGPDGTKAVAGL